MSDSSETGIFLKKQHKNRWALLFESLFTGLISGLVIAAFRLSINYIKTFRLFIYTVIDKTGVGAFMLALLVLAAIGAFIGVIIKRHPMIRGSGVAQLGGVFMQKLSLSPWPELPLKFVGGVLGIGCGLSIGREGPSVQLGAYIGDVIERVGKRSFTDRICLITAGAAAGLSATFNAPFAAIVFALEDLHQYLSPLLVVCVMMGAFAGDFTAGVLLGSGPIFRFPVTAIYPISGYIWLIGLGIFVALVGHGFKQSIYASQRLYQKLHISQLLHPVIPFMLSLPVGLWYGYASGGGDALLKTLAGQSFTIGTLLILLAIKILFTGISAGSGAIGGIFVPLLACGAVSGMLYADTLIYFDLLDPELAVNMLLFGMAACFTTVIKAPLTACVIVFETTGSLHHLSGLVLTCLAAYLTAYFIGSQAYDHILLAQMLETQQTISMHGEKREKHAPQIYEFPVQLQSLAALKKISETDWPDKCLIVGVMHGENETIPDGDTLLYPGDKLIILAAGDVSDRIPEKITALTSSQSTALF